MTTIVRRRKLGLTSVKGITGFCGNLIKWVNNFDGIPFDDVYIRWGCTSNLPNHDAKVINAASGIHRAANKSLFRKPLMEHGLCPETWWYFEDVPRDAFPVIVRTQTHAQGRGLWKCDTYRQLIAAVAKAGPGYYINTFIPKVAEYRVMVMQGRVVWVAKKIPGNPDDIAWNVNKGGKFVNERWESWPIQVIGAALEAWDLTKLHFSGIDVMVDEAGRPWVLEANSAPSLTSPYRQECTARAFDWMVAHEAYDRRAFNEVRPKSWKSAIHPGVRGDN